MPDLSRRGFLGALAALATAAAIPLSLKAEAEPILEALIKANAGHGDYLFLIRKSDWKDLWDALAADQRFCDDTLMNNGFISLFVRGVPVVHLDHADKILGSKNYALISRKAFEREAIK